MLSSGGRCIAARAKSGAPIARMHIGESSAVGRSWNCDVSVALPDTLSPAAFSNAEWDRGVGRGQTAELMLDNDVFGRLLIKTGDGVLVSPTDQRTIVSTGSFGDSKVLKLDGAPIRVPPGQTPVFGIDRK